MRLRRVRSVLAFLVVVVLGVSAAAVADLPKAVKITRASDARVLWTHRATVGEVLVDAGIVLGPHDRVVPSPAARLVNGMLIEHRAAYPVTLIADGRRTTVMTAATTVSEFLAERPAGAIVRPRDRVFPASETAMWTGAAVRVVRIETRIVGEREPVPYQRITRADPSLPRGIMRLAQAGRPGVRIRHVAVTTADGVVIERRVLGAAVVTPPQDHVRLIGTRRLFASRGEFAGKEIIYLEATAYAPWTGKGVDDITAIGMRAGYGVVAVDPRVIPLRSELFIEGYGRAIAGDTGGAIKGHRIDLGFNTAREAIKFGRRQVRVYILSTPGSAPRAPAGAPPKH